VFNGAGAALFWQEELAESKLFSLVEGLQFRQTSIFGTSRIMERRLGVAGGQ
jgi:hypothetical protein